MRLILTEFCMFIINFTFSQSIAYDFGEAQDLTYMENNDQILLNRWYMMRKSDHLCTYIMFFEHDREGMKKAISTARDICFKNEMIFQNAFKDSTTESLKKRVESEWPDFSNMINEGGAIIYRSWYKKGNQGYRDDGCLLLEIKRERYLVFVVTK
jgi:hypothetical protein